MFWAANNSLLTSLLITVDTMVCVPQSLLLSASLETCMCVHVHTHVQERSILNVYPGRESILSHGSCGRKAVHLVFSPFPFYLPPCSAVHSLSIVAQIWCTFLTRAKSMVIHVPCPNAELLLELFTTHCFDA